MCIRLSIIYKYIGISHKYVHKNRKNSMNIGHKYDQCKTTETVKVTNNVGYLELCCNSIIRYKSAVNVNIKL